MSRICKRCFKEFDDGAVICPVCVKKDYARPDNYGIGGGNINKIICDAGKVAKALLEKYPQRKDGTK